jgi:hypothetical protein
MLESSKMLPIDYDCEGPDMYKDCDISVCMLSLRQGVCSSHMSYFRKIAQQHDRYKRVSEATMLQLAVPTHENTTPVV